MYIRELVAASVSADALRQARGTFSLTGPLARGQRLLWFNRLLAALLVLTAVWMAGA